MRRSLTLSVCLLASTLPWAVGCRTTALGPELEGPQPLSQSRKPGHGAWRSDFAAHRSAEKGKEPSDPIQQVAAPPPASGDVKPAYVPPTDGPLLPPPYSEPSPPKPNAPLVDKNPASNAAPPPGAPLVPPARPPVPLPPPPLTNAPASNAPTSNAAASNGPGAPGPLPPGVTSDPHQREAPTAYGSVLQMPPGKTPIEKALELSGRLDACCADNAVLKERLRLLEEAIQARDRLLNNATRDFQDATTEMARVRRELESWAQDLKQQQSRLQQQDRDHQESLRNLIGLLEKVVGPEGAPPKQPPAKP